MSTESLYRDPLRHQYLLVERDDPHHLKILAGLLQHFGLGPGCRVIEIGAGFGRYTRLLRSFGLTVTACDPDPKIFASLAERFAADPLVSCRCLAAEALPDVDLECDAICGFHVLHHLRPAGLEGIAVAVRRRRLRQAGFRGWFFLEPNNLNPLYALQIALTPGMHFVEERGIWRTDYRKHLGDGREPVLGRIGLFPPRAVFAKLPEAIAGWQTALKPRVNPWSLYRIFGERFDTPARPL